MTLKDFDKLYLEYTKRWAAQNAKKLTGDFTPEHYIDEIYLGWLNAADSALDGKSPAQYFTDLDAQQVCALIERYIAEGVPVPSVLLDRASQLRGGEQLYLDIVANKDSSPELAMTAINILSELDSGCKLFEVLSGVMLSEQHHSEIRLAAAEILADNPLCVSDRLHKALAGRDGSVAEVWQYVADVLVNAGDSGTPQERENVFSLLCDLFSKADNMQLYAAYLGKFGDERALSLLYGSLKEGINYAEFLEIRSACEMLGGEVNMSFDFSDDPYFKALKSCK